METKKHMSYDGEYTVRFVREYSDGETVVQLEREGKPLATFTHDAAATLAVDILDKTGLLGTSLASVENVIYGRTAQIAKDRKALEEERRKQQRLTELNRHYSLKFFNVPYEGLRPDEKVLIMDHTRAVIRREANK